MKNRAHLFLLCNVISSLLVSGGISAMEQEPIELASPVMSPRLLSPHLPGPGPSPFEPTDSRVLTPKMFEQRQVAVEQDSPLCNVPYNVLCTICKYLVNPFWHRPSNIGLLQDLVYRDMSKEPKYIDGWHDINTLMASCKYLREKMPQIMIDNRQGLFLDFGAKRWGQKQSLAEFFDAVFKRINSIFKRYHTIPFELNLSSNMTDDDTWTYEGDLPQPSVIFENFFQRLKNAGIVERIIYLHLCSNNLRSLPDTLSYLTNLKALNLQYNELKFSQGLLPVTTLTSLEELELRNNKLCDLPAQMASLTNLAFLDVAFSCLQKQDIEILASLKKLFILDLSHNSLTIGELGRALGKKEACPLLRLILTDGLLEDRTEEEQQCLIELHKRGVEARTTC